MKLLRTLVLGALAALCLNAQFLNPPQPAVATGPNAGHPANKYGTWGPYDLTPKAIGTWTVVLWYQYQDGHTEPAGGQSVTMQGWATMNSGKHPHESTQGYRPFPTALEPFNSVTGPDGTFTWDIQWPPDAGWWTLTGLWGSELVDAENFHLRVGNSGYASAIGNVGLGVALVPLQGNLAAVLPVYSPYTQLPDNYHAGQSRYFTPIASQAVFNTAKGFNIDMNNDPPPNKGNYWALLNVERGSLPEGGRADNENFGPPLWITDRNEEHFSGTEADFTNPSGTNADGGFSFSHLVFDGAMTGCLLSNFDKASSIPMTSDLAYNYWLGQEFAHFDCDNPNFGRKSGGGGRGK